MTTDYRVSDYRNERCAVTGKYPPSCEEHTACPPREATLAAVLRRVIHHQLSHDLDSGDLAEAIDLLKYLRDEPELVGKRLEQWGGIDPYA